MVKEKTKSINQEKEVTEDLKDLILFNDDFNTFDYVIESLIEVCNHDHVQAEQCAWIAHLKGKCGVKKGTAEELTPLRNEMINRKLTVEIN
ncbi:MAG: ATP-dependent Clp protease adaptor ClpS [Bacteroidetes bacterium]|nr:ATP-dependent Clp protease adaptor ClpS [Bacteroidota bacterium]